MKSRILRACVVVVSLLAPIWLQSQTTGSPVVKDFVSGGRIEINLESGGYDIRPSADNRIHVRWNEVSGKGVKVKVNTNGKSATLDVENTPNNFHATIEVPAVADLRIRLTAGSLSVGSIRGDKDIEGRAGEINVEVGKSSEWSAVDASVTAGDLTAPSFDTAKGGLFRSLHWKGPGKYKLRVSLAAGSVNLRG